MRIKDLKAVLEEFIIKNIVLNGQKNIWKIY